MLRFVRGAVGGAQRCGTDLTIEPLGQNSGVARDVPVQLEERAYVEDLVEVALAVVLQVRPARAGWPVFEGRGLRGQAACDGGGLVERGPGQGAPAAGQKRTVIVVGVGRTVGRGYRVGVGVGGDTARIAAAVAIGPGDIRLGRDVAQRVVAVGEAGEGQLRHGVAEFGAGQAVEPVGGKVLLAVENGLAACNSYLPNELNQYIIRAGAAVPAITGLSRSRALARPAQMPGKCEGFRVLDPMSGSGQGEP